MEIDAKTVAINGIVGYCVLYNQVLKAVHHLPQDYNWTLESPTVDRKTLEHVCMKAYAEMIECQITLPPNLQENINKNIPEIVCETYKCCVECLYERGLNIYD